MVTGTGAACLRGCLNSRCERALALLREQSGTAFDPSCVAALEELLADEERDTDAAVDAAAARARYVTGAARAATI